MCPQALPLRAHHFQRVGKKPVLTLTWEPEDTEQEPVQQVRPRAGAAFPQCRATVSPPSTSSWGALLLPLGHTPLAFPTLRLQLTHCPHPAYWLCLPSLGDAYCEERWAGGSSASLFKAGSLTLGSFLRI